jgi:hypothetical protein
MTKTGSIQATGVRVDVIAAAIDARLVATIHPTTLKSYVEID